MFRMVELHLWLLALILVFAGITLASHFLFPSVRWFFRLRAERALARINARLDRPIELFKLARRQDMIVRLTYDPRVLEAVTEHATLTPPRANKSETFYCLKFTLDGAGERSDGYARTSAHALACHA
jgi:hypothetical protein